MNENNICFLKILFIWDRFGKLGKFFRLVSLILIKDSFFKLINLFVRLMILVE